MPVDPARRATARRPAALALAAALLAACAPAFVGAPAALPVRRRGYWIWHDGARWHLWATPGRAAHRFHGFVSTARPSGEGPRMRGARATTLRASDDAWQRGARQDEHGVGFDVTTDRPGGLSWRGRYAQFDVAIDGLYQPRRTRLGPTGYAAPAVPFALDAE